MDARLAISIGAVTAGLLGLAGALWVRYGGEVYLERVLAAVANCF